MLTKVWNDNKEPGGNKSGIFVWGRIFHPELEGQAWGRKRSCLQAVAMSAQTGGRQAGRLPASAHGDWIQAGK